MVVRVSHAHHTSLPTSPDRAGLQGVPTGLYEYSLTNISYIFQQAFPTYSSIYTPCLYTCYLSHIPSTAASVEVRVLVDGGTVKGRGDEVVPTEVLGEAPVDKETVPKGVKDLVDGKNIKSWEDETVSRVALGGVSVPRGITQV